MKNEEEKLMYNQYRAILELFNPPIKDKENNVYFDVADYYGTGHFQQKKDGLYCFYLIYDYSGKKNPLKSNAILLDTIEELIQYLRIMDNFKVNKTAKVKAKLDLTNVKNYEEVKEVVTNDKVVKQNVPKIF